MTNLRLFALCAVLLSTTLILPVRVIAGARGADTKPIAGAVDQLLSAWNKHDAPKFAAVFTDDGDFINTRGGRVHGRKAIADMLTALMRQSKASNHAAQVGTDVKMVKPDVALVLSRLSVKTGTGQAGSAFATLVLVNTSGKWRISACEIATGGK